LSAEAFPGGELDRNPAEEQIRTFDDHTSEAAYAAAALCGIMTDIEVVRKGPPAWIFTDEADTGHTPNAVMRLTTAPDPHTLLAQTQQEVALLVQLRQRGAQIQEYIANPLLQDCFVVTTAKYLQGRTSDHASAGKALATLHVVGSDEAITAQAPPFTPLIHTRQTYEYLRQLDEAGQTFQIADTSMPHQLLPVFRDALLQGEEDVASMIDLATRRGYPPTILHQDIHMGNVRTDADGNATLIDLDHISQGPAEYDLARPLGQWAPRFKRPITQAQRFMDGYLRGAPRTPDRDILRLAIRISDLRYAASTLTHAVDAVRADAANEQYAWSLNEGVRRLQHLHDPDFAWQSREERLQGS